MDLLLTHGYFLAADPRERKIMRPYPPLGILYLSSHLKRRGFDVSVFDTTFASPADLESVIDRERPPVVGIYGNLITRPRVLEIVRLSKARGARVVLGGPEPASYAEEYLARGADVVVSGEGEATLEELLPALRAANGGGLHGIPGIAFRDGDGAVVRTPPRPYLANLDSQPWPDRAAVDIGAYVRAWRERHGQGSVSLITARGCPYTCRWCSHAVFGHTHRRRSPDGVAAELETILADYRPDLVWYADDVFTINPRWLFAYAAELKRRGLRAPFETITREDRLNEDIVRCLAEMGCFRLWIGAESGSQRILDAMERRTSAKRTRDMIALLKRWGIATGTFLMLGYEGEEESDLEETVRHLKLEPPDHVLTTVAYPIKGTPYHDAVAARIVPLVPWEQGSDRLTTVAGRRSRRYYDYATRWILSEVERERLRRAPRRDLLRSTRALLGSRRARLGMMLTRREVERGPAPGAG